MAKRLTAPKGRLQQRLITTAEYGGRSFVVQRIEPLVTCTSWLRRPYVYGYLYHGYEHDRPGDVAWLEQMIDWSKASE